MNFCVPDFVAPYAVCDVRVHPGLHTHEKVIQRIGRVQERKQRLPVNEKKPAVIHNL